LNFCGTNANDFISNRNSNPPFGREENGKAKRTPFRYNNFGFTVMSDICSDLRRWSCHRQAHAHTSSFQKSNADRRYPVLSGNTVPDLNMRSGFPV
jgi:hypothetical protein